MSIALMRSECRKFAPNIFNKSKCTNCFRQKEEHSAEALESNRATRKVAKCGYLFVAPGWDFTNPLNRTKRWQRRWFVLYDDGELSYSVDEHPETVPQASIDMNKVLEVSNAEEVTGNAFSLGITAPDSVTFVKGTCREECRWWGDVLSVFPRSKGRHKRTATLPGSLGGATTTTPQTLGQQNKAVVQPAPLRVSSSVSDVRTRFGGWESLSVAVQDAGRQDDHDVDGVVADDDDDVEDDEDDDDVFPTRDVVDAPSLPPLAALVETRKVPLTASLSVSTALAAGLATAGQGYRDQPASSGSPPTRDKVASEDKTRTRRAQSREREQRVLKAGRSFSEDFASILPSWREAKLSSDGRDDKEEAARRVLFREIANECKRDEKLKDIAASITRTRSSRATLARSSAAQQQQPTRDGDGGKQVRGDPDGCGLDVSTQRYSPSSELRVDLPAEDLLNIKKGWLMKQGAAKEWNKHWFVLRGAALMYYRDPTSEDKGLLDGVIDLSATSSIAEVQVARNYGFQMMTWDERRYVLSAVTAGIRSNWMAAVRRAAGLPAALPSSLPSSMPPSMPSSLPPQDITLTLGEKLERELDNSHHRSVVCAERERDRDGPLGLSLQHAHAHAHARAMLFSSDDEYRTASSESCGGCGTPPAGPRESGSDWGETVALSLPPSPPLNRTPISRVKERARSRVCKRSRSSPPSSRRSTLDSVRTEDVVLACCGEVPESDVDDRLSVDTPPEPSGASRMSALASLQETAERQRRELEDMRSQLKLEALRLRQREKEGGALERQVKELLSTLERTEEQLKQRSREAAKAADQSSELDALKDRYAALLREHEALLEEWRSVDRSQDWRGLYQQLQDRYRHDKEVWEQRLAHSEAGARSAADRCGSLVLELESAKATVDELRQRLASGLEENESLYARLHDLEGRSTALALSVSSAGAAAATGREARRGPGAPGPYPYRSMDSLSDLTNVDLDLRFDELDKERVVEEFEELRGRFEKAVAEIRAMKRELRESHALYDELELVTLALRQEVKRREEAERAQASLMAARVEDLTLKLTAAEKQVRLLKQKLTKAESLKVREKRRSLSLKGRESFQICRELEDKLAELECKLAALEGGGGTAPATPSSPSSPSPTPSLTGVNGSGRSHSSRTRERRERSQGQAQAPSAQPEDKSKASRLRRKSLDSATSSEPMKVLIRLSALESKVANAVRQAERQAELKPVRVSVEEEDDARSEPTASTPTSRLITLEDVIVRSRAKMRDCMRLLGRASRASRTQQQDDEGGQEQALPSPALERSLAELEAVLQEADKDGCADAVSGEARAAVQRLERLLQTKLRELARRRQALRQAGQLDRRARLALMAEKLAYEAVLVGRLQQACAAPAEHKQGAELAEVDRYMAALSAKLDATAGGAPAATHNPGVETALDHLTRILSRFLQLQAGLAGQGQGQGQGPAPPSPPPLPAHVLGELLARKQQLDAAVQRFRSDRLGPLAVLLAEETLRYTPHAEADVGGDARLTDALRLAQRVAHETVNHELVQAEIAHVAARCAEAYKSVIASDRDADLGLVLTSAAATERVGLELWADAAEQALSAELAAATANITTLYEGCLAEMRSAARSSPSSPSNEEDIRRLLSEFADVVAHKALVDARVSLLRGEVPSRDPDTAFEVVAVDKALEVDKEVDENALTTSRAEFEYLFHKFCGECRLVLGGGASGGPSPSEEEGCSGEVMWALSDIKDELNRLQDCIQDGVKGSETDSLGLAQDRLSSMEGCWSWTDICAQCTQLRQQVVSLQSCVLQSQACQRCQQLQQQLERLESLHGEELHHLRQSQEKEMATLTGELEMQRRSLVCQHEMEQAQLKERARKLERRLGTLDSEYSLQMDNLHSAYQKTLAAGLERDLDSGENIRQRYQTEIEHLRALCEKGLVAMDNSHRRIIAELEEKHRQEAEQLRLEKEQALAEETQATLAALDAMRKAHEMEVQKEIAKFKAEFIKKMQATHDIGALHKEHEAEMEEIKQEILSLSEKYSVKCLESAALEEQLDLVSKQLAQAQQRILDLDARNKQLRAHLVSEASEDGRSSPPIQLLSESKLSTSCSTIGSASGSSSSSTGSSTVSVSSAGRSSHSSGSSVDSTHGSLGSVDSWSMPHQTPPQSPALPDPWGLRTKGANQSLGGSSNTNGLRAEFLGIRAKSKQRTEPAVLTSAELMRYSRRHCSSLPPLGSPLRSSSPSLSSLSSHSSSPCPLSGMVAERKKLFEQ